jgi:DNA-binding XRE family transcriptional regulator
MHIYIKTKEVEISAKGNLPNRIIQALRKEFGQNLIYKTIEDKKFKKMKPSQALKHFRQLNQMSQAELGEKLGDVPKQHISNMENGTRAISIPIAKKLGKIFKVPTENFL